MVHSGYLGVLDLVEVGGCQEGLGGELSQPSLVLCMIVKREDHNPRPGLFLRADIVAISVARLVIWRLQSDAVSSIQS